jgi:hypothetical protein
MDWTCVPCLATPQSCAMTKGMSALVRCVWCVRGLSVHLHGVCVVVMFDYARLLRGCVCVRACVCSGCTACGCVHGVFV